LAVPLIVTLRNPETFRVVTVNVADVWPAGTVTLTGTVAVAVLLLLSATSVPPVGAPPDKVTVPVEFAEPPFTTVGDNDNDARETGVTVNVADLLLAP
jgi:hypothetical protein